MTLRLADRITTLLRADAHGVVEALEEKSLLLKQNLREAELALLEQRAHLEALAAEEARVHGRAERVRAESEALDADVALALESGREELARFAIRRLLPLRRALADLGREAAALAASRAALAERLAGQEAEFEALRTRVRARLALGEAATPDDDAGAAPPVDEAEVEIELLRRHRARGEEAGR